MDDIKTDLNDFNQLHPNRKLAVFGVFLFLFIVAILVGIYFTAFKNGASKTADTEVVNNNGNAVLTLAPDAETIKVGDTTTVSILIDGEAVPGVDIAIEYDPASVVISNVKNGDVFEDIIYEANEDGLLSLSSAVLDNDPSLLKTGTLFTFDVEALTAGEHELTFNTTYTKASNAGENRLKSATGVTIIAE